MIITENLVRSYLEFAGFRGRDLNSAVRICRCESSFNTAAHNTSGEDSRGLMQINVNAHPQYMNLNLFDPSVNTQIAFELYFRRGKTFKDWTCAYLLGIERKTGIQPVNDEIILIAGLAIVVGVLLYYT